MIHIDYIDGLVQDRSIPSVLTMEKAILILF